MMAADDYLLQLGLTVGLNRQTTNFAMAVPGIDVISEPYSSFVRRTWADFKQDDLASGDVFELLVAALLYHCGTGDFYRHATLKYLHHTDFDFLLWDQNDGAPMVIQCTSTLRERFRLADLEAFRVKHFFPNAKTFLLTMDYRDTARLSNYEFDSLDGLIYAGDAALDDLFAYVSTRRFTEPPEGVQLTFKKGGIRITTSN